MSGTHVECGGPVDGGSCAWCGADFIHPERVTP